MPALYEPQTNLPYQPMSIPTRYRYTFEALDFRKRIMYYVTNGLSHDLTHSGFTRDSKFDLELERFTYSMNQLLGDGTSPTFYYIMSSIAKWFEYSVHTFDNDQGLSANMLKFTMGYCFPGRHPHDDFSDYLPYTLTVVTLATHMHYQVVMYCESLEHAYDEIVDAYINQPRRNDVPVLEAKWVIDSLTDPDGNDCNYGLLMHAGDLFDPDAVRIYVRAPLDFDITDKDYQWTIDSKPPEPATIGTWQ